MQRNVKKRRAHMFGIGLDAEDGHVRITQGENFSVFMGSEPTHERLSETCIKINERLKKKGKVLDEISIKELRDLVSDVQGE